LTEIATGQPASTMSVRELDLKGLTQQRTGQVEKPTVIRSAEELAEAFPEKELRERLTREVDFGKQQLLLFAGSGSGQDQFPAQVGYCPKDYSRTIVDRVRFRYQRGATDDVRHHVRLFVMPKQAPWRFEDR